MTEQILQNFIRSSFPSEGEAYEWKAYNEISDFRHVVSGREGEDIVSYISAISNMNGGAMVLGVEDGSARVLGVVASCTLYS